MVGFLFPCIFFSPLFCPINSRCLVLFRLSSPSSLLKVSTGFYLNILHWSAFSKSSQGSKFAWEWVSPCLLPVSLGSGLFFVIFGCYKRQSKCEFCYSILARNRSLWGHKWNTVTFQGFAIFPYPEPKTAGIFAQLLIFPVCCKV